MWRTLISCSFFQTYIYFAIFFLRTFIREKMLQKMMQFCWNEHLFQSKNLFILVKWTFIWVKWVKWTFIWVKGTFIWANKRTFIWAREHLFKNRTFIKDRFFVRLFLKLLNAHLFSHFRTLIYHFRTLI